jgi:hypothetical protein
MLPSSLSPDERLPLSLAVIDHALRRARDRRPPADVYNDAIPAIVRRRAEARQRVLREFLEEFNFNAARWTEAQWAHQCERQEEAAEEAAEEAKREALIAAGHDPDEEEVIDALYDVEGAIEGAIETAESYQDEVETREFVARFGPEVTGYEHPADVLKTEDYIGDPVYRETWERAFRPPCSARVRAPARVVTHGQHRRTPRRSRHRRTAGTSASRGDPPEGDDDADADDDLAPAPFWGGRMVAVQVLTSDDVGHFVPLEEAA